MFFSQLLLLTLTSMVTEIDDDNCDLVVQLDNCDNCNANCDLVVSLVMRQLAT